jgi:hypothetical protein
MKKRWCGRNNEQHRLLAAGSAFRWTRPCSGDRSTEAPSASQISEANTLGGEKRTKPTRSWIDIQCQPADAVPFHFASLPIAKGVHYMRAYMNGSRCCCGRASERFPEVLQRSSTLAKAEKASTRFPSRRVDQHHRNAIQPAQL